MSISEIRVSFLVDFMDLGSKGTFVMTLFIACHYLSMFHQKRRVLFYWVNGLFLHGLLDANLFKMAA